MAKAVAEHGVGLGAGRQSRHGARRDRGPPAAAGRELEHRHQRRQPRPRLPSHRRRQPRAHARLGDLSAGARPAVHLGDPRLHPGRRRPALDGRLGHRLRPVQTPPTSPTEIWDREVVCLTEVADPRLRGRDPRSGQRHPRHSPARSDGPDDDLAGDDGTPGASLVLSSRPVIASAVADQRIHQHPFMLWARVLDRSRGARRRAEALQGRRVRGRLLRRGQKPDEAVRAKIFIDGTRATDRPGFLLAHFTNGYLHLFEALGLDQLTPVRAGQQLAERSARLRLRRHAERILVSCSSTSSRCRRPTPGPSSASLRSRPPAPRCRETPTVTR